MKLHQLCIQGFKSIRWIDLEVDKFLCLIGQNNHGKSNIFQALELFFSSGVRGVTPAIFFRTPTEKVEEVIIQAKFTELSLAEMEKLGPWTVDGILNVSKKYSINDGKPQVIYEAIMRIPEDEWLRDDFEDYSRRDIVSQLPITAFLPESGRITKQNYQDAIKQYIESHHDIHYVEIRRENPAGYKQVLDGYLPEYYLVPAVRDVSQETKTSGTALLSRLLSIVISRISNQNPAFQRLQDVAQEIKTLIGGTTPEDKLAEIRDLESRLQQELHPWDVDLSINVEAPDIEKLFELGTNIILDDGIETAIEEKGHGLQRSLIFALMRVWAQEMQHTQTAGGQTTRERSHIFAFEEPELFLHPQMCRATYESLKQISDTDQVLICTHSPQFIDLEDYRCITIVKKQNLEIGTTVHRICVELFDGSDRDQFKMVRYFNPDRNELFFARKVVLAEGATEKAVLPLLGRNLGIIDYSISIIDCGSKFNLTLFMKVLNAFQIPYLVIHDEDPVDPELEQDGPKYDPDKLREARRTFNENKRIQEACDAHFGSVIQIPGKIEHILNISGSQAYRLGKPYAAVKKYSEAGVEIPDSLTELVGKVYE